MGPTAQTAVASAQGSRAACSRSARRSAAPARGARCSRRPSASPQTRRSSRRSRGASRCGGEEMAQLQSLRKRGTVRGAIWLAKKAQQRRCATSQRRGSCLHLRPPHTGDRRPVPQLPPRAAVHAVCRHLHDRAVLSGACTAQARALAGRSPPLPHSPPLSRSTLCQQRQQQEQHLQTNYTIAPMNTASHNLSGLLL